MSYTFTWHINYCLKRHIPLKYIIESPYLPLGIDIERFKDRYRLKARERLKAFKKRYNRKVKPHTKECYRSEIRFLESQIG